MTPRETISAGLIGHGIAGSLTPALHEAEGKALGIDYRYQLIDTSLPANAAHALSHLISEAEGSGYAGVNITHPYKVEVCSALNRLSPQAARVGAVNTVQFRDGERIGHNTDVTGFAAAFHAEMAQASKRKVLMLGAGGAGAAVAEALMGLGVQALLIHDKAGVRSQDLAVRTAPRHPHGQVIAASSLADIDFSTIDGVVNATPIGMHGHPGTAIDPCLLQPGMWVADIVYFPLETALLRRAKEIGCRTMTGGGMAVHQAAEALALITGKQADAARMAASFFDLINHRTPPKVLTK